MPSRSDSRYPPLPPQLSAHVLARLHAAARVLDITPERLVSDALDERVAALSAEQRELIDRIATSLLHAHDL